MGIFRRETLGRSSQLVIGSCVVYLLVAACTAGGPSAPDATGPTDPGEEGHPSPLDPVPPARADTSRSGTRLKATVLAGTDGSKQFVGWHDASLAVDCAFRIASDGKQRCLPVTATKAYEYLDPACTKRYAYTDAGCAPSKYVLETETVGAACGAAKTTVRALTPIATPAVTYIKWSASRCERSSTGPGDGTYSLVGSEVAASEFVEATTTIEP